MGCDGVAGLAFGELQPEVLPEEQHDESYGCVAENVRPYGLGGAGVRVVCGTPSEVARGQGQKCSGGHEVVDDVPDGVVGGTVMVDRGEDQVEEDGEPGQGEIQGYQALQVIHFGLRLLSRCRSSIGRWADYTGKGDRGWMGKGPTCGRAPHSIHLRRVDRMWLKPRGVEYRV